MEAIYKPESAMPKREVAMVSRLKLLIFFIGIASCKLRHQLKGSSIGDESVIYLNYNASEEENIKYDLGKNPKLHAYISSLIFTPHKFVLREQTKQFKLTHSGILSSVGYLDRDKLCPSEPDCIVNLEATLQVKDRTSKDIKVSITLEDINDNPPKFESHRSVINLSEGVQVGHVIILPSAIDHDGPQYGLAKYALEEIGAKGFFEIVDDETSDFFNKRHPKLKLLKKLDRETKDLHRLKLIAYDKGTPQRSGTLLIDVQIEDVNDNHPKFESVYYFSNSIEEHSDTIASIIQVRALDMDADDNGEVWYDFSDKTKAGFGQLFFINSSTGIISNVQSLDYESVGREIVLEVMAYDLAGNLSSSAQVIVHVEDINDNTPEIIHDVPEDDSINYGCIPDANRKVYPLFIKELSNNPHDFISNWPIEHQTVEILFSVADKDSSNNDNNVVSCQIVRTSSDSSKFRLDYITENSYRICFPCEGRSDNTDEIAMLDLLDREKEECHYVVISCSDGSIRPLASEAMFVVSLDDVNDNKPEFECLRYHLTITSRALCNGESFGKLKAVDPDVGPNAQFRIFTENCTRLSFGKDVANLFQLTNLNLDVVDGSLRLSNWEDEKSCNEYYKGLHDCVIRVQDEGVPKLSSVSRVYVYVNDSATKQYKMFIKENQPVYTLIGNIRSLVDHNRINTLNSDNLDIHIDPLTSNVYTSISLDYELRKIYHFSVRILDDEDSVNEDIDVVINVIDENDNSPVVLYPVNGDEVQVFKKFGAVSSPVCDVVAVDHDDGLNGDLTFEIVTNDHFDDLKNIFHINSSLGKLIIDFVEDDDDDDDDDELEEDMSYDITVVVSDKGEIKRKTNVTFKVKIFTEFPSIVPSSIQTITTMKNNPNKLAINSTTTILIFSSLFGVTIIVIFLLCWAIFSRTTRKYETKSKESETEKFHYDANEGVKSSLEKEENLNRLSQKFNKMPKVSSFIQDMELLRFHDKMMTSPVLLHMSSSAGDNDACFQCNPTFWTPQMARSSLNQEEARMIQKLDNYWTLQKSVLQDASTRRSSKFSQSYFPIDFTK